MSTSTTAQELITRAFAQAKDSGKADWQTMALPVLKNRLLQISRNTFREGDFAASSFRDFLQKNADLIEVNDAARPAVVTFKQALAASTPRSSSAGRLTIRPDLWRAVLDFSSGSAYVWDPRTETATVKGPDTQGPSLPTITPSQLDDWKRSFAEKTVVAAEDQERVANWVAKALPTTALPVYLRGPWSRRLKDHVGDLLQTWFREHQLTSPSIPALQAKDDTEQLRDFVLKCVRAMSRVELESLALPSGAAFRSAQR